MELAYPLAERINQNKLTFYYRNDKEDIDIDDEEEFYRNTIDDVEIKIDDDQI